MSYEDALPPNFSSIDEPSIEAVLEAPSDFMPEETPSSSSQEALQHRSRISRALGAAIIPLTVGALAFQQTPANESFRANRTFEVLEDTGDPLLAGATTLAWTIPIEGVAGALISIGLINKREFIQPRLEKRFRKKKIELNEHDTVLDEEATLSKRQALKKRIGRTVVDTGVTCAVGPGMVVAKRHFEESDRTFMKDMKTLAGYTTVGAGVSGVIGYMATGGIGHADKVGLKGPAEFFAENAADWKFWTGLMILGYGTKWTVKGTKSVWAKARGGSGESLDRTDGRVT